MEADDDIDPAVASILAAARQRSPPDSRLQVHPRSLTTALQRATTAGRQPIIAELKPTSPTAEGVQREDPVALATAMVDGGAAALSVLTEPDHFEGSPDALRRVREAVDVPVLRKDFILSEAQLDAVPADIVLLIARFIDDLPSLVHAAQDRGFQVLVETHTPTEVRTAINAGATIIGVNNRDLSALSVDLSTFERVMESVSIPDGTTIIAESGVSSPADVRRMRAAGADGVLIGSAIMEHDSSITPSRIRENTRRLVTA